MPEKSLEHLKIVGEQSDLLEVTFDRNNQIMVRGKKKEGYPFTKEFAKYLEQCEKDRKFTLEIIRTANGKIIGFVCNNFFNFDKLLSNYRAKPANSRITNPNNTTLQNTQTPATSTNSPGWIWTALAAIGNVITSFFSFIASFFSNRVSAKVTPAQLNPLEVIRNGDGVVKTLQDFNFIRKALANPEDPVVRMPLPTKRAITKKHGKLLEQNGQLKWVKNEDMPQKPKTIPTDTKSTSLTPLNSSGHGTLFNGTANGGGGAGGYNLGLLFDMSKLRPAKHAFFIADAYTNWKWWRKSPDGSTINSDLMRNLEKTRLSSYDQLKEHIRKNPGLPHSEVYAHTSKQALLAVIIRSELAAQDLATRAQAVCEKAKLEHDLGITGLPILIVNSMDKNASGKEYSIEDQKKDMDAYFQVINNDPSLGKTDIFGLSQDELKDYFSRGSAQGLTFN